MKQYSLYTNLKPTLTQEELVFTINANSLEEAILTFAKRKKLPVEELLEIFIVKENE